MLWNISNRTSGSDLGNFETATADEALVAMYRDAGYATMNDAARALGVSISDLGGDLLVSKKEAK